MRANRFGVLSMAAVSILLALPGRADAGVTAFLSPVTEVGGGAALGNPELTVAVGEPITLGLWVSAPVGLTVNGLALDIVETAGILSGQSFTVQEARFFDRWNAIRDPDMNVSPTELFTRGGALGGLAGCLGLAGREWWRQFDPNFDPNVTADGAFLHAIVEMRGVTPGDTDLFLKVGCKKVGYGGWEIDTTDDAITFGSGDVPVNRRVAAATGVVPDATIHVLPGAGLGDMNGDGRLDNLDTTPFVAALVAEDEAAFLTQYPNGYYWAADTRMDGNIDNLDITPYVNIMSGGAAGESSPAAASSDLPHSAQSATIAGDVSGDGNVDFLDITPFFATLVLGEATFASWYPDGDYWAADTDGDGNAASCGDIIPFIAAVMDGDCSTATPEPTTMLLLAAGGPAVLLSRRAGTRQDRKEN